MRESCFCSSSFWHFKQNLVDTLSSKGPNINLKYEFFLWQPKLSTQERPSLSWRTESISHVNLNVRHDSRQILGMVWLCIHIKWMHKHENIDLLIVPVTNVHVQKPWLLAFSWSFVGRQSSQYAQIKANIYFVLCLIIFWYKTCNQHFWMFFFLHLRQLNYGIAWKKKANCIVRFEGRVLKC